MVSYDKAESIAIAATIPDGKVYYSGDVGTFYIFIVVSKNFSTDIEGAMFGTSFTAVDKADGRVWTYQITDGLPSGVSEIKTIVGRKKN